MKKRVSTLLLVILAMVAGCKNLGSEQKVESESADANPPRTISDTNITLNNEPEGTVNELDALRDRVNAVMEVHRNTLVFKAGTTEIENTVFLLADSNVPVKNLAETAMAIDESGGKAYLPKNEKSSRPPSMEIKPNPLTLVVKIGSVGPWIPDSWHASTPIQKYAYSPTFQIIANRKELKRARITGNSLEISANDNYFVNEGRPVFADTGQDEDDVDVLQHAFEADRLEELLPKVIGKEKILKIIASENASTESLLKIFEAGDRLQVNFNVIVRGSLVKK